MNEGWGAHMSESLFAHTSRVFRAPTVAPKERGLQSVDVRERSRVVHENEIRRARRDDASRNLAGLIKGLPEFGRRPEQLPPLFTCDSEGTLAYLGSPAQAFTLLAAPSTARYGLFALRQYYHNIFLGHDQMHVLRAELLVHALVPLIRTETEHTCVLLGVLASRATAFCLAMQERVLPELVAMLEAKEAPVPFRASALVVMQHLAMRLCEPLLPHLDTFALYLTPTSDAHLRLHAASLVRYLCRPPSPDETALDTRTYEAYLPELFTRAYEMLQTPEPSTQGYGLCALARLATERDTVLDKVTQDAFLATLFAQVHANAAHPGFTNDALELLKTITYSPRPRHCAPLLRHLPSLWLIARTQPAHAPTVAFILRQVCADSATESAQAVFTTLFPSPQTVPATLAFVHERCSTQGADLLGLLWRCGTVNQRHALQGVLPILFAALDEPGLDREELCEHLDTLVRMVRHSIRHIGRSPAKSSTFRDLERLGVRAWLETYLVREDRIGVVCQRARALLALLDPSSDPTSSSTTSLDPFDV